METNRYRTSGVIDESTYPEINKAAFSRKYIWFTRITAIVMAIFALLMFIAQKHIPFVFFVAAAFFFIWRPRNLIKSTLDNAVKRLHEAYPAGYIQMETWFTDEGMAIHNLSDGARLLLSYSVLGRVAETERYFYVATKTNQFNLVFKDMLTPDERAGFLPFLQSRCPDIKVVR